MIGNIEDAELIGEWDYETLPDGWFDVGEGSSRNAYISPDGVVYKVEQRPDGSNSLEYMNYLKIQEAGPLSGWAVPETSLYILSESKAVIAMEYIEGVDDIECEANTAPDFKCTCHRKPCVAYEWEVAHHFWGVVDLSYENIRVMPDGTRVLIDLGA